MKRRSLLYFVLIFAFYAGITFYIGWNGWVWLHSVTGLDNKWIYSISVGLLSYSYIIGQISKRLSVFKIIGPYWFGLLQYAVLILPLSNLAFSIFILLVFLPIL